MGLCRSVLTLMTEDAPHEPLREVFNGLRWIVRAGAPWRMIPNDLPPWYIVYQQRQRWMGRMLHGSGSRPAFACGKPLGRTHSPPPLFLTDGPCSRRPESGGRAGYDGAKRRKGSKVHIAVDTLGNLLALYVTPANEQDRAQVGELAQVQEATEQSVRWLLWIRATRATSCPGRQSAGHRTGCGQTARTKQGFVLLPRRWVVERSFAWTARFRRLAGL